MIISYEGIIYSTILEVYETLFDLIKMLTRNHYQPAKNYNHSYNNFFFFLSELHWKCFLPSFVKGWKYILFRSYIRAMLWRRVFLLIYLNASSAKLGMMAYDSLVYTLYYHVGLVLEMSHIMPCFKEEKLACANNLDFSLCL